MCWFPVRAEEERGTTDGDVVGLAVAIGIGATQVSAATVLA